MIEGLEDFRSLVIKKTLSVHGGNGVEVIDLGRKNCPETWLRFRKGCLYILGGDGGWHEIDEEVALLYWQVMEYGVFT